jgi:hypothetical protein
MSDDAELVQRLRDEVKRLNAEMDHLEGELERYRTATEDALQQLDWCIGYFTGARLHPLARSLGSNRAYIRRHLMHRPELSLPADNAQSPGRTD